jgi:4-alpha-glucanotransferase
MKDEALKALARRAGIALEWRDYANKRHAVSFETARRILSALGFACDTPDAIADSTDRLEARALPPLITATVETPIDLPIDSDRLPTSARVVVEDGTITQARLASTPRGARLCGLEKPGYHVLEFGDDRVTLAVAPARCFTAADITGNERLWGLTVQTYGLRSPGDCGIGDMGGVAAFARTAAKLKVDALALSPMHALFASNPNAYSPYSPSSRLFYNPLLADSRPLFGDDRVQRAMAKAEVAERNDELADCSLINWHHASALKLRMFRCLFDDFLSNDLTADKPSHLGKGFFKFCKTGDALLHDHAVFEALHAARTGTGSPGAHWRAWPASLRSPHSAEVTQFAHNRAREVQFHCFLQWIADSSLAATQSAATDAGMRIGLISDLAVGMSGDGSHAWSNQHDVLSGLKIGAPPDLYNQSGQNWGLTTFSPWALRSGGFAPFIATLRAALRHAGGVRIDHVMGLLRLWVIPNGAGPQEGAYLTYPIDDLLRLTALESLRHRALVIGEDLGTVPPGFRGLLAQIGIYGTQVLWFERKKSRFLPPQDWSTNAAAMTSTHDLPTVAGWWRGHDIETRRELGLVADPDEEMKTRQNDRKTLWRSFEQANAASGKVPARSEPERAVDAAVQFIAQTPSELALVPLEEVLALEEQPNLPGTIDEHPNWRRRYPGEAGELLDPPQVRERLAPLIRRGAR